MKRHPIKLALNSWSSPCSVSLSVCFSNIREFMWQKCPTALKDSRTPRSGESRYRQENEENGHALTCKCKGQHASIPWRTRLPNGGFLHEASSAFSGDRHLCGTSLWDCERHEMLPTTWLDSLQRIEAKTLVSWNYLYNIRKVQYVIEKSVSLSASWNSTHVPSAVVESERKTSRSQTTIDQRYRRSPPQEMWKTRVGDG